MGIADISIETRALIDEQLIQIARLNASLGIDSKVDEKIECRRQINLCLKEIKRIDAGFYKEIVPYGLKD
jgi:hypothetical protein